MRRQLECGKESKCWYLEFCLVLPVLYLLQSATPRLSEGVKERFGLTGSPLLFERRPSNCILATHIKPQGKSFQSSGDIVHEAYVPHNVQAHP